MAWAENTKCGAVRFGKIVAIAKSIHTNTNTRTEIQIQMDVANKLSTNLFSSDIMYLFSLWDYFLINQPYQSTVSEQCKFFSNKCARPKNILMFSKYIALTNYFEKGSAKKGKTKNKVLG